MTTIIGAGMAGLLTAAILRNRCKRVIERSPSLPNNHSAVLRFRTKAVADALNIRFKEVTVVKSVRTTGNIIADAMQYSWKTSGTYALRSIMSATNESVIRYVSPSDLISQMMDTVMCPIQFGVDAAAFIASRDAIGGDEPIISTIPMPNLMAILDYKPRPDFRAQEGVNITADVDWCEAYASMYVPSPTYPFSRVSLEGSKLIIECPRTKLSQDGPYVRLLWGDGFSKDASMESIVGEACDMLGIDDEHVSGAVASKQRYAKIAPIDDTVRKNFIMWASAVHRIYSVGRYATWRPGLLLDDVVNDVRVVTRLIDGQGTYDYRKDVP